MADELVNAGTSSSAEPATAPTGLVPRSALSKELPWADHWGDYLHPPPPNNFRHWWRLVYRHKLLILSVSLLIMPFLTIHAYRAKPIYQAAAALEVRPEESAVLKPLDSYYRVENDNTKAEIYIIQSRSVLARVIANLKLEKNPRFLEADMRRTVWEAIQALSGSDSADNEKLAQGGLGPAPAEPSDFSIAEAEDAAKTPAGRARLRPYLDLLSRDLRVEPVKSTRLLKIVYTHTDPELAAQVANGIAEAFKEYNFKTKTKRFDDTSTWLEETTRKLKAQVEQAEAKLADYSRSHNIYSSDNKEDLATGKLAEMHTQAMKAETDRLLRESLYEEVKQGRVNQLPEAFADPKTAALRKELNDLAVHAAQYGVKFGPRHPRILEIRQQMAVIQEQIDSNRLLLEEKLKADYERALREEKSLRAALDTAKTAAAEQNQSNIQFSLLQQDLNTAKTLYTDFLNKTNQASLQRAEQYNNVRLVELAEPPDSPIGPNRSRTILIGLLFTLLLGVGLAWLLENLNTSIRHLEDINQITRLPLLAAIPPLEEQALLKGNRAEAGLLPGGASEGALVPAAVLKHSFVMGEYSRAAEAYRRLRTSILLSTAGHPPKIILVTSGQPGDGKTTTTLNTAVALTQLDARVLIIDCDMRKPRIHSLVQVEKDRGLSNFLSLGGELADLIKATDIPHLSILPSGPIPPNPSELLSSAKMKDLLSVLAEKFDYVLVDSPPVVTVTDPMILSTMVDGVILVVKSGVTKSEVLRRTCQDLAGVGAKVLGLVLNDYNPHRESQDYYSYYRYNYDYKEHKNGNGTAP